MAVELKVPPLGESITEAVVGKWNKKQGDSVAADEPLVVLETDKVTIDVPSPAAGSIASIAFKEGDKVRVGEVLGTIEAGGAGAAAASPAAATPAPAQAAAPVQSAPAAAASDARITPTAKKMAEENQVDVGQLKGSGTGGRIVKEDVLGQLNRPAAPAAPT
ncbi:dihydrolipoamide succinyltransferase, partial [Corallococcus sp. CA047B]|uniref:biotin/lipoyl-containing protein n=1 Tax=Corallococcus sp. CA047B TaxID=2316729 RepID=UPI000EDDBC6A